MHLNRALRDRCVCGLNHEKIQNRLLNTANLTFKLACETARDMEMAEQQAKEFVPGSAVHKVDKQQPWKRQGDTRGYEFRFYVQHVFYHHGPRFSAVESDCVRERCQPGDGSRLRCDILCDRGKPAVHVGFTVRGDVKIQMVATATVRGGLQTSHTQLLQPLLLVG